MPGICWITLLALAILVLPVLFAEKTKEIVLSIAKILTPIFKGIGKLTLRLIGLGICCLFIYWIGYFGCIVILILYWFEKQFESVRNEIQKIDKRLDH